MTTAASIWVKLLLDQADYKKGLTSAKKDTKDFADKGKSGLGGLNQAFEKTTGFSLSMAGAVGVAGIALQKTVKFLNECEAAANESNIVMAKQEAILKATGNAAGLTADQLGDMAEASSKLTGIDDEVIADAQSMLLTFRNIKAEDDIFERTQAAALDLSTTFGGITESAKGLGMALNSFDGYTRLARSGVTFSEEQKKQIKNFAATNDLLGYQKLLLEEIEKQVGGTAAAMEAASDGSNRLAVSSENLKEAWGQGMTGMKREWNTFWADTFDAMAEASEKTQDQAKAMQDLGISAGKYGWVQNGVKITREQAEAAIAAQIALMDQAEAIVAVGDAAEKTAEQLEIESKARQSMYTNVTGLAKNLQESEEKLLEAEQDLAEYISEHPMDSAGIQERKDKIDELKNAQNDMVNQWMLNVYTQMLTADQEMSEADMAFLLQFQVDSGLISEENKNRALSYWEMADEQIRANETLQASINSLKGKEITITTIYKSLTEGGTNSSVAAQIAAGVAAGNIAPSSPPRALGGTTIADQMYEVAEGGVPEMLTVNNKQYLMMGSQNGEVRPLAGAGGSEDSKLMGVLTEVLATTKLLPGQMARAMRQNVKYS
ncbi:MAG: hypothetical protein CVU43_09760 [Chloroflexi bacterium HGW-Chloroflexi-5]|jgi:hypothetical protein|nr:MAG: hypothetical protein CVU43_09760 [Chloroflexi bacterium HGW-Chloroflexi-5]